MQYIRKGNEPQFLKEYKETPGVCFDGVSGELKVALKKTLLDEQGYICCYCGKQIALDENTIIEHLLCRSYYRAYELDYDNLLASCDGGQAERRGKPQNERRHFPSHCDDKKNNSSIDTSPLCPDCESYFTYLDDGSIGGDTDEARNTIKILGLDCPTIRHRRKAAIEAYKDIGASLDEEGWKAMIKFNSEKDKQGKYPEYCFAVRGYIKEFCL